LIGLREFEDDKADVVLKYSADEARRLKTAGEIPDYSAWLVAVPVERKDLYKFTLEDAKPENAAKVTLPFIKPAKTKEAEALLLEALDWNAVHGELERKRPQEKKEFKYDKKIEEEYFPPCIKLALAGLKDGKKRTVFTLISFLRTCNWEWDEIEKRLYEWNEHNTPKLSRTTILSQLRWAEHQNRKINPANCAHDQFYVSIGLCQPDRFCTQNGEKIAIKNPVVYPFKSMPKELRTPKQPKEKYDKKWRGWSCDKCNREFKSPKALAFHKGRSH